MKIVNLKNKVAVVTGASTGIGRVCAKELSRAGAYVILLGRNNTELQETLEMCSNNGEIIIADLSKQSRINRAVRQIMKSHKSIDILINAAGVWHNEKSLYHGKKLFETSRSEINEVLNVAIDGTLFLTRGLLGLMTKNKCGKIVNISGTFENGANGWLHYYVAKKSIEAFTVGLSHELNELGIQVNCISPSDTATESYVKFFPEYAEEALDPKEVGKAALYLVSGFSGYISGQIFEVKT